MDAIRATALVLHWGAELIFWSLMTLLVWIFLRKLWRGTR